MNLKDILQNIEIISLSGEINTEVPVGCCRNLPTSGRLRAKPSSLSSTMRAIPYEDHALPVRDSKNIPLIVSGFLAPYFARVAAGLQD